MTSSTSGSGEGTRSGLIDIIPINSIKTTELYYINKFKIEFEFVNDLNINFTYIIILGIVFYNSSKINILNYNKTITSNDLTFINYTLI